MKALLIVNDAPEIIYLYHNEEFQSHVMKLLPHEPGQEISFSACLQNYISPIVLSCVALKAKLNEACTRITCANGEMIAFQKFDHLLFIGMQKAGACYDLEVQLNILHCVVELLYGPAYSYQLNPHSVTQKNRAWMKVSLIVESYFKLHLNEKAFVFEAIEQLKVSTDVSEVCGRVIHRCMASMDSSSKLIQHGLIFVDTKLLSYQLRSSKSDELLTRNLLHIISLLSCNFLSQERSAEEASAEEETSDYVFENAMHHGIFSTDEDYKSSVSDGSAFPPTLTSNDVGSECGSITPQSISEDSPTPVSLSTPAELKINDNHFSFEKSTSQERAYCLAIFLPTNRSPAVPYLLYCVPVTRHIKMVFLSKRKHAEMSDIICGMLYLLKKIKFRENTIQIDGDEATVLKLEACHKELFAHTKKIHGKLAALGRKISESWKTDGQKQLQIYLNTHTSDNSLLERCVKETERKLLRLFVYLFHTTVEETITTGKCDLQDIQQYAFSKLSGYDDYFSLKSKFNIATFPLTNFPGLVQFALVRRVQNAISQHKCLLADEVVCPLLEASDTDTLGSVKEMFYRQVQRSFACICEGRLAFECEIDNYTYSSHLWCVCNDALDGEEMQSTNVPPTKALNNIRCLSLYAGHAYRKMFGDGRKLYRNSITVFHLHCVHFSIVPLKVIKQQQQEIFSRASVELCNM